MLLGILAAPQPSSRGNIKASSSTSYLAPEFREDYLSADHADLIVFLEKYQEEVEAKMQDVIKLRLDSLAEAKELLSFGLIPTMQKGADGHFAKYRSLMKKLFLHINELDEMKREAMGQAVDWELMQAASRKSAFLDAALVRAKDHREDVNTMAEWTFNNPEQIHHHSNTHQRDAIQRLNSLVAAKEAEAKALAWKYRVDIPREQ